jgi:hypothetical protein
VTIAAGDAVTVAVSPHLRSSGLMTVRAGVIDAAAVDAYRNGQCFALADAIASRTGWLIGFSGHASCRSDEARASGARGFPGCRGDRYPGTRDMFPGSAGLCGCQVEHFGALLPDGRFLDITGPAGADRICEAAGTDDCWIAPAPLAKAARAGRRGWMPPHTEAAALFADAVLAQHGLLPRA